ncbi:MAG: type II toxin-antitoxin system RelE/ParE family toxin [Phycisphaerae bacterium]|nr:type II toxin-antitoxin system RelE/ParE family toxin [Phycisphaerae bacterium]
MKRTFIFDNQVQALIREQFISEQQVRQMETEIMLGYGKTVPHTAGIKKIRCGAAGRGKRGGIRVLFADYPKAGKTHLLAGLTKNQRADFSQGELKILCVLKRQLDKIYEERR